MQNKWQIVIFNNVIQFNSKDQQQIPRLTSLNPNLMFQQENNQQQQSMAPREDSKLLSDLSMMINKFKILAHLQNGSKKQDDEIGSMADANKIVATHLVRAFQLMRDSNNQDLKIKIMNQINSCDKTMKLLQIKLIDTVEILMKGLCITYSEDQTVESLYQQFYVTCSQFMNSNYEHSNQICMILSKDNQQSDQAKTGLNGNTQNQNKQQLKKQQKIEEKNGQKTKSSNSKEYFLLKHMLDKISSTRKNYEAEINNYENQIAKLQSDLQQSRKQIANLMNTRDELIQDLCQFQQAVEAGKLEQVKLALGNKNYSSEQENKMSKVKQLKKSIQLQRNDSITKLNNQITNMKCQKQQFQKQNIELKKKIQQYRNQIFRAARIMSLQNRQIYIGDEKVKQYRNHLIQYSSRQNASRFNPKNEISPLLVQSKISISQDNSHEMQQKLNGTIKSTQKSSASLTRTKSPIKFVYKNYEPATNC